MYPNSCNQSYQPQYYNNCYPDEKIKLRDYGQCPLVVNIDQAKTSKPKLPYGLMDREIFPSYSNEHQCWR